MPSCDRHNGDKSGDDEFLKAVLTISIQSEKGARDDLYPSVLASLRGTPKKMEKFARGVQPIDDSEKPAGIYPIQIEDFTRMFDSVSRGLYWHLFGYAWLGPIKIELPAPGVMNLRDPANNLIRYRRHQRAEELFQYTERVGRYPDKFYFQHAGRTDNIVIRSVFLGGFPVLSFFNPPDKVMRG